MKILKTVQKIPGGMMVVPLILGALVNTFFGDALKIGGFTTALFKNSASCLIGLFIFCNGAMINIRVNTRLMKDKEYAERLDNEAEELLRKYARRALKCYKNIEKRLSDG